MENKKLNLTEGYIGQTVNDFLDDVAGISDYKLFYMADINDDEYNPNKLTDESQVRNNYGDYDFIEFDTMGGGLLINTSDNEYMAVSDWFETIRDVLDCVNEDYIEINKWNSETNQYDNLFAGDISELEDEHEDLLDLPFLSLDVTEGHKKQLSITYKAEEEDEEWEEDEDIDENLNEAYEDEDYINDLINNNKYAQAICDYYSIDVQIANDYDHIYKSLGYPVSEDYILPKEVAEDNNKIKALYNAIRKQVIFNLNKNQYAYDTPRDERYGTHNGTETILKLFNIKKTIVHESSNKKIKNNFLKESLQGADVNKLFGLCNKLGIKTLNELEQIMKDNNLTDKTVLTYLQLQLEDKNEKKENLKEYYEKDFEKFDKMLSKYENFLSNDAHASSFENICIDLDIYLRRNINRDLFINLDNFYKFVNRNSDIPLNNKGELCVPISYDVNDKVVSEICSIALSQNKKIRIYDYYKGMIFEFNNYDEIISSNEFKNYIIKRIDEEKE